MKFNSELIKKAHEMTREIKNEYGDVDYKTQFGICLSYLLNNNEEEINVEDKRISELRELAKVSSNYNKVWNEVEKMSKEIRKRKFNRTEQLSFNYKAENIINLAIQILKDEVKEVEKVSKNVNTNRIFKAKEKCFDAETNEWIETGDDMQYVRGLGWVRADNY